MDELDVITAGIPLNRDNCPVMTRVKAFMGQEGVYSILEHTFRMRDGRPADLSVITTVSDSVSAPSEDTVLIHIKEVDNRSNRHPVIIEGDITNAAEGTVRMKLTRAVAGQAGLYQISWGFVRNGEIILVNNTLLSIERNLFGPGNGVKPHQPGPPTIGEIRARLWDSGPGDNLLLDDVEFSDDQILSAILWPVQDWNEKPPPVGTYNTFNFPFRSAWIDAAIGQLYLYGAAFYRRNKLNGSAGGVNLNELDRDGAYMEAYKLHLTNWNEFRDRKKLEANMALCTGTLGSSYSS